MLSIFKNLFAKKKPDSTKEKKNPRDEINRRIQSQLKQARTQTPVEQGSFLGDMTASNLTNPMSPLSPLYYGNFSAPTDDCKPSNRSSSSSECSSSYSDSSSSNCDSSSSSSCSSD